MVMHLKGMKAICQYTGRSESTILKLTFEAGFPATKIHTLSIWESDTELIDEWNKGTILKTVQIRVEEAKRPDVAPMVARHKNRSKK